ncbi:hypothetical protein E2553_34295 [Paraburkholderia dipogonis]|uniref:Uncharacterized protein n=1 Tax=Paraburkholderia dipogonis TaxID=1211383 RepID=A0A4Y8MWF5_9BURK|nr:hypothetical protein E2553_34295 [Paraburkholderia dipogonis]
MDGSAVSLRSMINKWLAPTSASPIRLTRISCVTPRPMRCVRAECMGASGSLTIIFFRHDNGSWCVFPPASTRPSLLPSLMAA